MYIVYHDYCGSFSRGYIISAWYHIFRVLSLKPYAAFAQMFINLSYKIQVKSVDTKPQQIIRNKPKP